MKTMRHLFSRFLLSAAAVCGLLMATVPAQAQVGEKTLGIAGGYASYNNGGYADIYFQYTLANHVRIAPEIGYIFRNEGKSGFEFSADVQFPFRLARSFNVYPLVGFTLNNWEYSGDGHATRAGADFGAGFDIYLMSNFKLSLQGKYSLMNDTSGGFFNFGFGYVF